MTKSIWKRIADFFRKPAFRLTGLIIFLTVKWLIIVGIISGFMVGGVAVGYLAAVLKEEPVRSKEFILEQMSENIVTGFVYFKDETVIGQLRSEEDRRLAELTDIPKQVLDATLAIEDKSFYEHYGVDLNGIFRAAKQKLLNEDVQTGGSTITQQLARRVFLTLDRDISRKFKEIFLSIRLELMMSKDEILLAYLNKIPYGNGSNGYTVYGIKAAAKGLFDKDDLNDLNIAQSAYLAGLPQLPSTYSAFTGKGELDTAAFERANKRQQLVLKRMLEENKINQQQYEEALAFDLKGSLAKPAQKAYTTYPYLMLETERKAAELLVRLQYPNIKLETASQREAYNEAVKDARNQLLRAGYHIYTTIDKIIYDSMQDIAKNPDNFTPDLKDKGKDGIEQIGAIMIENKTGAILGMMEGRSFYTEQLNHATQAYRQPGSTMKPIAAFIPALDKGIIQPASVIDDVPLVLPDGQKGVHLPENWNNKFHGLITARQALNQSYNIPALKLFIQQVGVKEAWNFASKLGITSITKEDEYALTGVIGGLHKGVSVEEMTNAYASIPNHGMFLDAYMIEKIVDNSGKVIYEHERKPERVYSEQTAYLMTDMLRTVITQGTAKDIMTKFKYYKQVAVSGKTGSTQDDADAWFMGYTPDITVGVWAGYDQPINKLKKPEGTNRAKTIWSLVMNETYEKRPELFAAKTFDRPKGIVEMTVSSVSGKLPNELTSAAGKSVRDLFNKAFVPVQEDDVMIKMKVISYNGINYLPHAGTPEEFLQEKIVYRREKSISSILKEVTEANEKLPKDKRKNMNRFVPLDADLDAPSETDPRTDDGAPPPSPLSLLATRSGETNRITFQGVTTEDVVGYRLYRSVNGGPYERVSGKSILQGAEPLFTDSIAGSAIYGYYVTAIDVAGRESSPSQAAFTDGVARELGTPDSEILPSPSSETGQAGQNEGTPNEAQEPAKAPTTPKNLKISTKGLSVQLTWEANPQEEQILHYVIYFNERDKGAYRQLDTIKGTEYITFSEYEEGYFRIAAVNAKGESTQSKSVHFKKKEN